MKQLFKVGCNPEPGLKGSGFICSEPMTRAAAIQGWTSGIANFRKQGWIIRRGAVAGTIRRAEIVNPYSNNVDCITAVLPA